MSSGKAGGAFAEELGIPPNSLYHWRKALDRQPDKGSAAEVATLRRELERVRQQRGI